MHEDRHSHTDKIDTCIQTQAYRHRYTDLCTHINSYMQAYTHGMSACEEQCSSHLRRLLLCVYTQLQRRNLRRVRVRRQPRRPCRAAAWGALYYARPDLASPAASSKDIGRVCTNIDFFFSLHKKRQAGLRQHPAGPNNDAGHRQHPARPTPLFKTSTPPRLPITAHVEPWPRVLAWRSMCVLNQLSRCVPLG